MNTDRPSSEPIIDTGTHVLKKTRHGYILYLRADNHVGVSLDLYGEYSEGEIDIFSQFIKPGMTIVDGGANFGTHTVYFAKTVGNAGTVYALEPQRLIFKFFVRILP